MNHRKRTMIAAMLLLALTLCACSGTKEEAQTGDTSVQEETAEVSGDAAESEETVQTPVTVESLFAHMRSHERAETFTTVTSRVGMVSDDAAVKIPVNIDLGAEFNMRGDLSCMHIEGKAGVSALVLNYDYPFETYATTGEGGLTLYLYQNETDTWARIENITDDAVFTEGNSLLSPGEEMFTESVLTEEEDRYRIHAVITAERVSSLLFHPGMIDITALESLGFSLKDIRFDVDIYFDKAGGELTSMVFTCPEEASVNGFTMESFTVETTYLAFDDAVETVVLPAEIRENAVPVQ